MKEKQWWTFTFGYGQEHEGMYVKIYGTYDSARRKMFERYGSEWAFQYSEKEWKDWEDVRPEYMVELLLESISDDCDTKGVEE